MKKVYIDPTPNANILKFVCDRSLTADAFEFEKNDQALESPMAQQLLQFPFVTKVYITANFVAVQKIEGIDWELIANDLKELINEHLNAGTLLLQAEEDKSAASSVYVEMTPNPEVMKFIANHKLFSGIAEAKSAEESHGFPIAKALFEFDSVKEVFGTENYISITKQSDADWNLIAVELRDFIAQYLQAGKSIIDEDYEIVSPHVIQETAQIKVKDVTDLEKQIKDILVEYIQPAVVGDGGNIELIEFQEDTKTAKMLLQGACSGCPSSTLTLKQGIETMLKEMLPGQVDHVEAING